ncbi:glycine--tRNA ligase subunit beta [soil metagenome]
MKTASQDSLLVELFVEELPPKALKRLGDAFAEGIVQSLAKSQLIASTAASANGGAASWQVFASPRRLGVLIQDVAARAADRTELVKLMPVSVGLDASGQPTPALQKRLAAMGLPADATLERQGEGKAEALFYNSTVRGPSLAEGLQTALDESIAKLPIPKVMTYQLQDGWTDVKFVRPAHSLVALHGSDVVPVKVLGLTAGRETHGHRFEASHDPIVVANAGSYESQLEREGAVIASFAARRAEIVRQLAEAATAQGRKPIDDEALLDEVTGLVERPTVLTCSFEPEFLAVPQECLILTMKANQKYFPLLAAGASDAADGNAPGKLTNQFLVVSNIRPADASRVIGGNERVVRPRLADAKFFYDQDRKHSLESRVAALGKVVYHGKLGTQGQRTERVRAIAAVIARRLGGDELVASADRAALLAKTDLLTDMVGEFPELQGIMGGYYARHDGLGEDIALAIEDHYKPRFAGDALPRNPTGLVVALADKLETLVGLFGICQLPTGDKDPFALRRHALGVIRMLTEEKLALGADWLVHEAFASMSAAVAESGLAPLDPASPPRLLEFIYDRLSASLREQGFKAQEVDAVLALRPPLLHDIAARLNAVRDFAALPEAEALAAANKRVGNILKKGEGAVPAETNAALFSEPAERALDDALRTTSFQAEALFAFGDYSGSLQTLAALRQPVDAFFESVMVNTEDVATRGNRMALLAQLHAAMNRVADLSRLAT